MEAQNEAIIVLISAGLVVLAVMWYLQRTQRIDAAGFSKDDSLIILVAMAAIGVALRVYMAYRLPGYQSDMDCFRAWAREAYAGGLDHFYDGEFFADYPPLYVYVLYILGAIQSTAGLDIMGPDYAVLLRMPSIICELIITYYVYRAAIGRWGKNTALTMAAFILLNPALMMNSAVWGQIDSIAVLAMLCVFYLLYKKKYVFGVAVFMLAFLLKPQVIMVAPVILYVLIGHIVESKQHKGRALADVALCIAVAVAVWFLVPLPFGLGREPLWLVHQYVETIGEYSQASLNAFNIYGLVGLNFLENEAATVCGTIAVAGICAYAAWLYIKNHSRRFLFAIAGFIVVAVFSLVHGMHERYLYPAPFFLLVAYILLKDKRLLDGAAALFALLLVNQGVSLYYYGEWIPQALVSSVSILELGAFGYVAWTVTSIALHGTNAQVLLARPEEPAITSQERIEHRLTKHLGYRKCDRKDLWIMLLITGIYAVVAFTNLGTFDIPQTSAVMEGETTFTFEQPEHITVMKYYADYGEGTFDVEYSEDGQTFYPLTLTASEFEDSEIAHEVRNLYKWQVYKTDVTAKAVRTIGAGEGTLPVLEFAFFGPDGQQYTPVTVQRDGTELAEWTDEQSFAPYEPTYLTDFYFDEIYHVRTAYENIHLLTPYEITHPPLGKIILAIGIELFGMNSIGWRFMGTLAGVAMVPVMYVFARMLFRERKYAVYTSILLCADFMHFAQTRIGTIDSYSILWIILMYLFMYRYACTNFNRERIGPTLVPLFLSGLFFGIGAATKWLCLYAGLGLLAVYILLLVGRYREYAYARETDTHPEIVAGFRRKFWIVIGCGLLFFIVMPAAIYLASYTPYTLVEDGGAYGFQEILGNQSYMLNYHANLNPDHVHPFSSKWYTWPADIRPVLFFSNQTDTTIATLSTMGNPFLWWSGIFAVICLCIMCFRERKYRRFGLLFLAIGALAQFAPWWFISREVFIYHYFAVIPFLILLIVYWLRYIAMQFKWGRAFGYVYVGICVAFFAAFYPVITGVPAAKDYINAIRWLESWPFY